MIRKWFSICGMALGISLMTACTTAGMDRVKSDGSRTHLYINSLNGESLAALGGMAGDAIQQYLPYAAGGGVAAIAGVAKLASSLGARSAHKVRDAADAAYDEGAARKAGVA